MKLLFSIIIGIISIAIIIGCEKASKGPEYLQESVAIDIIETLSIMVLGICIAGIFILLIELF